MKNRTSAYYPVFLDVKGRRCLVIGGGTVALRKVKTLLDFGAQVEVISPRLCAGLKQLLKENNIIVLNRKFHSGDLKGAYIAIAATAGKQTNAQVADEAHKRNILINVVDDPVHCDFILPSYFRRGAITISVSTSGMSPALARKIRSQLEKQTGPEYEILAVLVEEIRAQLKKEHIKVSSSRWQEALDLEHLTALIRDGRRTKAKRFLFNELINAGGNTAI